MDLREKRLMEFALGEIDAALAASIGGRIPWDHPEPFADYLTRKVNSGEFSAISIKRGETTVAGIVYEVTELRELVLHALAGIAGYDGLTAEVDALAAALASRVGATSIRIHTQRATIAEAAQNNGYHVAEIILRKRV